MLAAIHVSQERIRQVAVIILLTGANFSSGLVGAADSTPYPAPENYALPGGYFAYATRVQHFLASNPRSAYAPRIALDLLVVASALEDGQTAAKMGDLLLLDYTNSVQAKFVVGQFKDVNAFLALLAMAAEADFSNPHPGFAAKYMGAVRLGAKRFGRIALGQRYDLLRTAVIARDASDREIFDAALTSLREADKTKSDVWQIGQVLLGNDRTPVLEQLKALHALSGRTDAIPFETYLISKLPEAERASIDVIAVRADNLLEQQRLADALPLLAKLSSALEQPRTMFWEAWATAAAGDSDRALELLATLRRKYPSDQWSRLADEVELAIHDRQKILGAAVESTLAASNRLKNGIEEIELEAVFHKKGGHDVSLYLGVISERVFDLQLREGEQVVLAYHTTSNDSLLYSESDNAIHRYRQRGLVPTPVLTLTRGPGGGFSFYANLNLTEATGFTAAMNALATNKYLTTADGLQELFAASIRGGYFPLNPTTVDGQTEWTWVLPRVNEPVTRQFSYSFTSDKQLASIRAATYEVKRLRYGPADAFELKPPSWPHARTIDHEKADPTVLFRVIEALAGLFTTP